MSETDAAGGVVPEQIPFLCLRRQADRVICIGDRVGQLGTPVDGRSPDQPDGVFARWQWDGEELTIRNDRYGFYPLFYSGTEDEISLSPSIPLLVSRRGGAELDYDALALFLRLGFFIGDDTPFRGIRALPPGATVSWSPRSGLRVAGGRPRVGLNAITRTEARDAFIELFRASLARRLPAGGPVALPLSGGKDSRHILLELFRAGVRPTCVTLRLPGNEDAAVARELAGELHVPHVVLEPATSRVGAERRKNVLTSFCADEHGWYMPVADHLRSNSSTVYDGVGGDVLSCSSNLSAERIRLFRAERLDELAQGLWAPSTEAVLRKLLPADVYRRVGRDLALSRITEELRDHVDAPNPIGSFFFFTRTRREIALTPYALLRGAGTVHAPFLDHDLYDLLAGLPSEMLLDRTLHTDAIRHAFPEAAHIRFGGRTAGATPRGERWRYAQELLRFTLSGRVRLVRRAYLLPRLLRYAADPSYEWSGTQATYLIQLYRMGRTPPPPIR